MIEIKRLSKKFAEFSLKNINFQIETGEFVGILGQSGSGKSTILNLIAGLDKEYEGDILIEGETPRKSIKNGDIAMVFQQDLLLPHLNVWENIAFGLKIKKIPKEEIEKRIKDAILEMDLIGKEKRYPNELSGGEKQRVSIARAIVTRPKLLLMDEPFSALDFNLRDRMQKMVKNMHKKLKITIVFVTHDREEAFFLSDKIGVMFKGELLDFGTPQELYYNPKNVYTAKLLAMENIFSKKVFEKIFMCKVEKGEFVGLRGKDLKICEKSEVNGEVIGVNFGMGEYNITLKINGEKIVVVKQGEFKVRLGDIVGVTHNEKNRIIIEGVKRC
ncbi:ABC transporter ATP-binding protein [uncultured Cetobacterium sp.]|uniref:ABC transporter ATP-binding protein n=1 Tax=uncultured Cetobacterium sp. TaxID=527638 RepID=UPI002617E1C2|nr:ABC transporter ATP-binding protein [uncultured Cetobacterium sp.]